MGILGYCYKNGIGVEVNLEKAFYWFKKSAEAQYRPAMLEVAMCYFFGRGICQDQTHAWLIFSDLAKSAKTAEPLIQYFNGLFLYDGVGGTRDLQQARVCLEQAAQNNFLAKRTLEFLNEESENTRRMQAGEPPIEAMPCACCWIPCRTS